MILFSIVSINTIVASYSLSLLLLNVLFLREFCSHFKCATVFNHGVNNILCETNHGTVYYMHMYMYLACSLILIMGTYMYMYMYMYLSTCTLTFHFCNIFFCELLRGSVVRYIPIVTARYRFCTWSYWRESHNTLWLSLLPSLPPFLSLSLCLFRISLSPSLA